METDLQYLSSYIHDITPWIVALAKNAEKKGWAECHAGNFSIRCPGIKPPEHTTRQVKLDFPIPEISHQTILIKRTGVRFRDCEQLQENSFGILHFNANGSQYEVWHGDHDEEIFIASTEFLSHLLIHQAIIHHQLPFFALFHTHPTELMAFTHRLEVNQEALMNQTMKTLHTEFERFYPNGIGLLDVLKPGSLSLAEQTSRKIVRQSLVLWKNHGSFSIGKDLQEAFDLVELANKVAQIYCLVYPGKSITEIV